MKTCYLCGAFFQPDQVQEVMLDLKREWICEGCAKLAALIAGQVKIPGWIVGVWQPRNLRQLTSRRGFVLEKDELADLCESGRTACMNFLQDSYNEYWNDFGLDVWLEDQQTIDYSGNDNAYDSSS